jgi:hypothetical protein
LQPFLPGRNRDMMNRPCDAYLSVPTVMFYWLTGVTVEVVDAFALIFVAV